MREGIKEESFDRLAAPRGRGSALAADIINASSCSDDFSFQQQLYAVCDFEDRLRCQIIRRELTWLGLAAQA
jgi:hypothetical protein